MRPLFVEHRRAAIVGLGSLVLVVIAIVVVWQRGGTRPTMSLGSKPPPPIIMITWDAVGEDVEPWSGVGLGEQVRHALHARGVVVTDGNARLGTRSPNGPEDLATRGRLVHATYVLGGTVGRKGRRSEIGMQLVRVQDGATVWTSTFWRDPTDLDSLSSELAVTIAEVLTGELSRAPRQVLP
jgi:TolB-like protein